MLIAKLRFRVGMPEAPSEIGIALLECYLPEEEDEAARSNLALLDADFFDDECVVIVYRLQERESESNRRFFTPGLILINKRNKPL